MAQTPSGQSVGWYSRLQWDDQPHVYVGTPRAAVPAPFQGLTVTDRHSGEPQPEYTGEEEATLCEVCRVPEVSWHHHRARALHRERARASRANPSRDVNSSQDALEEALAMLRCLRPDLRRQVVDAILDAEDGVWGDNREHFPVLSFLLWFSPFGLRWS